MTMAGLKPARKTRFFANLAESCLKCDVCDARFWIQSKLDKHYVTHVQPQLTCSVCNATFGTLSDLSQHSLIHKPLTQTWICSKCAQKFLDRSQLLEHLHLVHSEKRKEPVKHPNPPQTPLIAFAQVASTSTDSPSVTRTEAILEQGVLDTRGRKSIPKVDIREKKRPLVSLDLEVIHIPSSPKDSEARLTSCGLKKRDSGKGRTVNQSDVQPIKKARPTVSATPKVSLGIHVTPGMSLNSKEQSGKKVLQVGDANFRKLISDQMTVHKQTSVSRTLGCSTLPSSLQISAIGLNREQPGVLRAGTSNVKSPTKPEVVVSLVHSQSKCNSSGNNMNPASKEMGVKRVINFDCSLTERRDIQAIPLVNEKVGVRTSMVTKRRYLERSPLSLKRPNHTRGLKLVDVSVLVERLSNHILRECAQKGCVSLRGLKSLTPPLSSIQTINQKKQAVAATALPKNVKVVTVSADFMKKLKESFLPKAQPKDANHLCLVVPPRVLDSIQMMTAKNKSAGDGTRSVADIQNPEKTCPVQTLNDAPSAGLEVKVSPNWPKLIQVGSPQHRPSEASQPVVVYGVEDMQRDTRRRKEYREKMQEKEKILKKMLAKFEEKEHKKAAKYRAKKVARILEKKLDQLCKIQEKLVSGKRWVNQESRMVKEIALLGSGEPGLETASLLRRAGLEALEEEMGLERSYHLLQQEQKESPKIGKVFPSVYRFGPEENDSLNSSTIKYTGTSKRLPTRVGSYGRGLRKAKRQLKTYGGDPFTDLSMITSEKYIMECPCVVPHHSPCCQL